MYNKTINIQLILKKMQDDTNCGKLTKLILSRFSVLGGFWCELLEWDEVYI